MEDAVALKVELDNLLKRAADVATRLSRADGTIRGVPHYSVIEAQAHAVGKQFSREVQGRQMRELTAEQPAHAQCPRCQTHCEVEAQHREVKSIDGPVPLLEREAYCPACRRAFFPR